MGGNGALTVNDYLLWLLPNIGPIIAAVGLFLTIWALRRNHDWNRRQYAMTLLADWNDRTSNHKEAIERAFPGLVVVRWQATGDPHFSKSRAKEIYNSLYEANEQELDGQPEPDAMLRSHMIELLNYFELIAIAYWHRVADQQIVEEGFRGALLRWYAILHPFIEVSQESHAAAQVDHKPWEPFVELVNQWKQPGRTIRRPTA
jgi:Domain of unknown function (DUF4760)